MNTGCSTVAVKSPDLLMGPLLRYRVLLIGKPDQRVEPRGIEPLTSALPVRLDAVAVVRGRYKNRLFKPNS
jgi:hypothetical protein